MLDKLFGNNDRDENREPNDEQLRARQTLIRERMQAQGITEDEATRLVLSEEELAIGKREVQAGEVEIGKHVETQHVQERVALRHDEVEVERRPITDGYSAAGATIGEDGEIRIPLYEEEAVVEKRVVPTEELVVKKEEVIENEVVEADLRRERAEIHEHGAVRETTDRTRDRGLGR